VIHEVLWEGQSPQTAHMNQSLSSALSLARVQGGVLTAEQAAAAGVGHSLLRRMIDGGQWIRLATGLYQAHPAALEADGAAWAGLLLGGPRACIAGEMAAHLQGFASEPEVITVAVPHEKRVRPVGRWQFERRREMPLTRGEPARTTVEETVLDLCDGQPDRAEHWVMEACRLRLTTRARLLTALQARLRIRSRRDLADLLAPDEEGVESPLERRYLKDVERAHGLPRSTRQVRAGNQRRDVVYEEFGVVVELDGRRGHEGAGAFRDMTRDNGNTASGWITLRYGWADCTSGCCSAANQVGATLQLRGWRGEPCSCTRCRLAA